MSGISHACMMSINQYAGMIAEKQAWYYLEKKGFEVRQFAGTTAVVSEVRRRLGRHSKSRTCAGIPLLIDCPETPDDYLKPKYAKKLRKMFSEGILKFFENLDDFLNFMRFWEACKKDIGTHESMGLDIITKKDGKFYLVEVKANKSILNKSQREALLKSKDYGFIPLLIRVKVEIKVPLEKVRIKEL